MIKNLPVPARDTGDMGLIPGLVRSLEQEMTKPLQYSCLDNSMDRGVVDCSSRGCKELDTTEHEFPSIIFQQSIALIHSP